jgi:hypothetical protein
MSSVSDLIETVRGLPGKANRSDMVARMLALQDKLTDARTSLIDGIGGAQFVDELTGRADSAKIRPRLKRLAKDAKDLSRLVQQQKVSAHSNRDDELTIAIREASTKIKTDVRNVWREFSEDKSRSYSQLADASSAARLEGCGALRLAAEKFQAAVQEVPSTRERAEGVTQAMQGVLRAVESLGLTGKVGQFLVASARGEGNPKTLFDPEVRGFLEEHDALWSLLRLRLG